MPTNSTDIVNCAHCGNTIEPIGSAWIHVATHLVSCRRGKSTEHSGIYRAEPATALDDNAVAEIAARGTTRLRGSTSHLDRVVLTVTERDALCATVRALREVAARRRSLESAV